MTTAEMKEQNEKLEKQNKEIGEEKHECIHKEIQTKSKK